MSVALRRLARALPLGPDLLAAVEALVDPAEPYELGLALSVSQANPSGSVLVSYNPRARGTDARLRCLRALARLGLPLDAARAAMAWVPDTRCSTVLGLEGAGDPAAPRATLYLEEVDRFHLPQDAARTTARLAALAGVPSATLGQDPGQPYIWALDLGPGGVEAFKVYRLASPQQAAAVDAALAAEVGVQLSAPWGPALAAGAPAAGFILQRRHRAGQPVPLKVYKTYAYDDGSQDPAIAAEVDGLLAPLDPLHLRPRMAAALAPDGPGPATSVGLRLAPGSDRPAEVTAYWCLARGPGPAR